MKPIAIWDRGKSGQIKHLSHYRTSGKRVTHRYIWCLPIRMHQMYTLLYSNLLNISKFKLQRCYWNIKPEELNLNDTKNVWKVVFRLINRACIQKNHNNCNLTKRRRKKEEGKRRIILLSHQVMVHEAERERKKK